MSLIETGITHLELILSLVTISFVLDHESLIVQEYLFLYSIADAAIRERVTYGTIILNSLRNKTKDNYIVTNGSDGVC